jgi:hypothetical protein
MSALEATPSSSQNHASQAPRYSFITVLDPSESSLPAQRKAVRSHAAWYQHSQEKKLRTSHSSKPKKVRKPKGVALVPGETIIAVTQHPTTKTSETTPSYGSLQQITHRFTPYPKPLTLGLGQGRVDPFRSYPIPWEPFIPELVDHCSYTTPP